MPKPPRYVQAASQRLYESGVGTPLEHPLQHKNTLERQKVAPNAPRDSCRGFYTLYTQVTSEKLHGSGAGQPPKGPLKCIYASARQKVAEKGARDTATALERICANGEQNVAP